VKRALRFSLSAAIFASVGFASVGTAEAVAPTTKVHVAVPRSLFNKHLSAAVQALVARILKEECEFFPSLCQVVVHPLVSPSTTVVPPPTTVTTVPTTVSTTVPVTVVTLPVITVPVPLAMPATIPANPPTTSCTVTVEGGGVAQCYSNISVNQG
jgi:hypothetical protein